MKKFSEIRQDVDDKIYSAKWKAKKKIREIKDFAEQNPEITVAMIPVGLATVKGALKLGHSIQTGRTVRREQHWKDTHMYDRSLGTYLELRRKPDQNEALEITRRLARGERKAMILQSMGLLK